MLIYFLSNSEFIQVILTMLDNIIIIIGPIEACIAKLL